MPLPHKACHPRLHFSPTSDLPYRPPASKQAPGDCTFRSCSHARRRRALPRSWLSGRYGTVRRAAPDRRIADHRQDQRPDGDPLRCHDPCGRSWYRVFVDQVRSVPCDVSRSKGATRGPPYRAFRRHARPRTLDRGRRHRLREARGSTTGERRRHISSTQQPAKGARLGNRRIRCHPPCAAQQRRGKVFRMYVRIPWRFQPCNSTPSPDSSGGASRPP